MNFCEKCGAKLNEDTNFCGSCGAKINRTATTTTSSEVSSKPNGFSKAGDSELKDSFVRLGSALYKEGGAFVNKSKDFMDSQGLPFLKKYKKLVISGVAGLVAVIALIVGISVLVSNVTAIQLTDYITIDSIYGENGNGRVRYSLDEDKLCTDILGEYVDDGSDSLASWQQAMAYDNKCYNLTRRIDVSLENNGEFSNGDYAVIVIEFDNDGADYGRKIKGGTYKVLISGLVEE